MNEAGALENHFLSDDQREKLNDFSVGVENGSSPEYSGSAGPVESSDPSEGHKVAFHRAGDVFDSSLSGPVPLSGFMIEKMKQNTGTVCIQVRRSYRHFKK